jgi:hypothetical protein
MFCMNKIITPPFRPIYSILLLTIGALILYLISDGIGGVFPSLLCFGVLLCLCIGIDYRILILFSFFLLIGSLVLLMIDESSKADFVMSNAIVMIIAGGILAIFQVWWSESKSIH